MPQPKLISDVINSPEFWAQREKAQKHVRFEFQDYAYRLANDLGDLGHRPIYMRLAKTTDRFMLEQAAAFAMDYAKERNKGKIFMWKLSQLRGEAQMKKNKLNMEMPFVMKQMSKLYDELCDVMNAKQKQDLDAYQQSWMDFSRGLLEMQSSLPKNRKVNVIDGACGPGLLTKKFLDLNFKVTANDISPKLVAMAKRNLPQAAVTRKLSFDKITGSPQGIWLVNFWHLVPLDQEESLLQKLSQSVSAKGYLFFDFLAGGQSSQQWQEFDWREKTYLRFEKISFLSDLQQHVTDANWKILDLQNLKNGRTGLLLQKLV